MAPKRKRGIAQDPIKSTARKRTKLSTPLSSPAHPHGNFDPEREYKVRSIIEETRTHYRIDWEDDEVTGEHFDPTWEPKANVNAEAISDWERQRNLKSKRNLASGSNRPPTSVQSVQPVSAKRARGRPRKVIRSLSRGEESSPANYDRSIAGKHTTSKPIEISESQDTGADTHQSQDEPEESLFLQEQTSSLDLPSPDLVTVQPSAPPSSYVEYDTFNSSQVLTGTAPIKDSSPGPSQYQPNPADTSKTTEGRTEISIVATTPTQNNSSGTVHFEAQSVIVVPDSQSLPDSSSFAPSQLQKSSESSNESSNELSNNNSAEYQLLEELRSVDRESQEISAQPSQAIHTVSGQSQPSQESAPVSASGQPCQALQEPRESLPQPDHSQPAGTLGETPGSEEAVTTRASEGLQEESQHSVLQSQAQSNRDSSSQSHHLQVAADQRETAGYEPQSRPLRPWENDLEGNQQVLNSQSQPVVITVTGGVTPSVRDFGFSSQFASQIPAEQRQAALSEIDQQGHPLPAPIKEAQSSNSFPFETQIAPALNPAAEANIVRQPPLSNSQPVVRSDRAPRNFSEFTPKAQSLPLEGTSPLQTSSPLPSVPSHSVPLVGESAPPRPTTPSSPTQLSSSTASTPQARSMESQASGSGDDLLSKLKNMRAHKRAERERKRGQTPSTVSAKSTPIKPSAVPARLNAEIAAESSSRVSSPEPVCDGTRSPSTVPAAQPVHVATQDEMTTAGRYGTLLPQEQDSSTLRRQSTITGTTPKHDAMSKNHIHAIPLALMGLQRDTYQSEINRHRELIDRFLASSQPDEDLMSEIEGLIERLRHILIHPDLVNPETFTQYEAGPVTHADWAVSCSAKFRFLEQLIGHLRKKDTSIAMVAQSGQLLHILETFLSGLNVNWQRVDAGKSHEAFKGCALTVNILPPHEDGSAESISADMVVELESGSSADSSAMKPLQEKTGQSTPLLMSLIIPNTIEHIERCLSPNLPRAHRLRSLVHAIFDLRFEAGKLEEGQTPSAEAATALVAYLTSSEPEKKWPITALSVLENLDSQTESEIDPPSNADPARTGSKRAHDNNDIQMPESDPSKRARMDYSNEIETADLPTTINPLDMEITRVSESINKPDEATFSNSSTSPSERTEMEKRLQTLLHTCQDRLAEHERALSDLQYRHEEQRTQLIEMTKDRDAAIATAQRAVDRMTEQAATLSSLRAERTALQTRVESATAALHDHSVPERAELEQLRQSLAQAEAEKAKLDARMKAHQRDLDYAQEMYQTSSSSAQALASQNAELEKSVALFRSRAAGEQLRARHMTLDSQAQMLQRENGQLKALLKDRERTMALQVEELKQLREASRGRVGTRASSVPRSPRMGSPRKFAAGSRQGSPVAGDLRGNRLLHPLRQG